MLRTVLIPFGAFICSVVACSGAAVPESVSWSTTGGGGAAVKAVAIAPDRSGVMYMVTLRTYDVMFYRSEDYGSTWRQVGKKASISCDPFVPYSLFVDPDNHDVVYGYTCGFVKSTDGGETWTEPTSARTGALAVDPWQPGRFVVWNIAGTSVSTDGGSTWDAPSIFNGFVNQLVFDPAVPNRLYVADQTDVWRSTDGGGSWWAITTMPDISFAGLALDPADTHTVYAWGGGTLYRTVDDGAHWTAQSAYVNMKFEPTELLCSAAGGGRLYATGFLGGVFTSGDAGKTWTSIELNLPFSGRHLTLVPGNPERLWLCTGGGLFSKPAGSGLWQDHNRGLASFSNVLATAKDHPERLYAIGSDAFYRSSDAGVTWFPIRFPGVVSSAVIHPADALRAWFVGITGSYPDNQTEIHETTDGGVTWTRVDTGGLPGYGGPYPKMIGDRSAANILYLAVGGSLLKSTDYGRSWVKLQPGCDGTVLLQDFSSNPALYIRRPDTSLARSTDRGQTWEDLPEAGAWVQHLAIEPRDPNILYSVSFYTQINRSTDGGKSWQIMRPLGGAAPRVTALAVDPYNDGVLYAADESNTICVSRDEGRHWAPFQPEFPLVDLPIDFLLSPEGRLFVGTRTGGIRYIDLGRNLDFLFPQIGDGEGAGAGRLQTTIQVMNQAAATEAVVSFFDSAGQPLALALGERTPSAEHRIHLGRGQSFSGTTAGTGPLKVGYARVSGGPGLAGAAVYSHSENGTTMFQAGVPSSPSISNFGLFFDVSPSEDNGLALTNTSAAPVDPRFSVIDAEGQTAAVRKLSEVLGRALNPGEHVARYVSELFPQLLPDGIHTGVIAVESEQPISPVTLRQNDQPGVSFPQDVGTLSAFPVYSRPLCCNLNSIVFPQVVDGIAGDVQAQTILRLVRTGTGFAEFYIKFLQSDGSPMNVEIDGLETPQDQWGGWYIALQPGASTTLRTKGSGPLKVGYAFIYSTQFEISGTAFYSWKQNGIKLFETGVPASEALNDFSVFFDSEPGLLQTGLALVNMGFAPANVTFRLYDRAGQLRASRTWPNYIVGNVEDQHHHKARFISEILPEVDQLDVRGGVLTVHSDQPVAAVTIRQRDNPAIGCP
ncbi:MAG: hypothetical protein EHM18_13490 [Acidobacteria bacterium]|nr:MAG: hypothetical protein EHM18_13490 [Acidobacteriota bacterium]